MKKYSWFILAAAVLGVILAIGIFSAPKKGIAPVIQPPAAEKENSGGRKQASADLIRVAKPASGAEITSPLEITGEARGTWFFEASFPIRLTDENGKVLGSAVAMAQGDWMTEEFVPFKATLVFDPKTARAGKIILDKDNPSDMRELDASLEMPVSFPQENMMAVKIFFGNTIGGGGECSAMYPLERRISKTQAVARAAIEQLLAGPSSTEKEEDYFTSINEGVKLLDINIRSGTASVDFDEQLEKAVGGSCRVAAIRSQINNTLKQFPTIKQVVISINGRTEDILQP